MSSSATLDVWEAIAREAAGESVLWAAALRPAPVREPAAVFSPLAEPRFGLGLETIYEGYLVHYGAPRLFAPADPDAALLLGDYLYAHGLVRITALGEVEAVERLAELLSLCAHLRAEDRGGDGNAWATTVGSLAGAKPTGDAVERALALHGERVD